MGGVMGDRGPRPLPTAAKVLKGTFRADRAASHEWKPDPLTADEALALCPKGLPAIARRLWKHLAPQLAGAQLLSKADVPAFIALCSAYARAVQAEHEVAREGLTIVTLKGFVLQHPAVSIARTSWAEFRRFCQEFGLTPSARSRVGPLPSAIPDTPDAPAASRFRFGRSSA